MTTNEEYREVLQDIVNILGPIDSPHTLECIQCEGCRFEWKEALRMAQNVLDGKDSLDHWGPPIKLAQWNAKREKDV